MARRIHILPAEYRATVRSRTVADSHAALCNELEHLRAEIKRLDSLNIFKDEKLLDAARFLEDVLRHNKPQSIGQLKRLISRLKGAANREQGGLPE